MRPAPLPRLTVASLVALAGTAIYLSAAPSASVAYVAAILGHVAVGFVLSARLWTVVHGRRDGALATTGWLVTIGSALAGIALAVTGGSSPFTWLLRAHIALATIGVITLGAAYATRPRRFAVWSVGARLVGLTALSIALAAAAWSIRVPGWERQHVIRNPSSDRYS